MYSDKQDKKKASYFFDIEGLFDNTNNYFFHHDDDWSTKMSYCSVLDKPRNYKDVSNSLRKGATSSASKTWFAKSNDLISHNDENFSVENDKDVFEDIKKRMKKATSSFWNSSEWNHVVKTFNRFIHAVDDLAKDVSSTNIGVLGMYKCYNNNRYSNVRVEGKELANACNTYIGIAQGRKEKKRLQDDKVNICNDILTHVLGGVQIKDNYNL